MATHYEIEFREHDDPRWFPIRGPVDRGANAGTDDIIVLVENNDVCPVVYGSHADAMADAWTMKLRVTDCDFRVAEVLTVRGKVTPA